MNRTIWLVNIGANRSHPYRSPLFPDGRFELLPIPETPPEPGPHSVRFRDLRAWNDPDRPLSGWIPERWHDLAAHYDPEFHTTTYGDNCERAPRAAGLRKARTGDLILFIARLEAYRHGRFTGEAGFFLVGYIEVSEILRSVYHRPPDMALNRFVTNAHVRRGLNADEHWDGFWVFAGSQSSERFPRAVPVDRSLAQQAFLAANGDDWRWDAHRSDLQTIGSYTRSCRAILAPGRQRVSDRAQALTEAAARVNPRSRFPALLLDSYAGGSTD